MLACSLEAQTVSSFERTYGPYLQPAFGATPAIAVSRTGILFAWSEIDPATRYARVKFALLDAQARLISEISVAPSTAAKHAYAPLVATDGESFLLVWAEEWSVLAAAGEAIGLRVDAAGHAIGSPFSFGLRDPRWLVWDRSSYFLNAGGTTARIASDGTRLGFESAAGIPFDGTPVSITSKVTNNSTCAFSCCGLNLCSVTSRTLAITWSIGSALGTKRYTYSASAAVSEPAFAGDGRQVLVAWSAPGGIEGFVIRDGRVQTDFLIPGVVDFPPPGVAFDGTNFLVTYGERSEIRGALFDAETLVPRIFTISATARGETDPHPAVLPNGFLVVYASDDDGDHRLAGRVVITAPARRRAVR